MQCCLKLSFQNVAGHMAILVLDALPTLDGLILED